jgi:hypothetical protein
MLGRQSVVPDMIVVSACDDSDVEDAIHATSASVLFGSPGLAAQRNRALSLTRGKYDTIIFFDDDFIPSRFWIERVQALLTAQHDIVCVTGNVLLDGVVSGGIEGSQGRTLVDKADACGKAPIDKCKVKERQPPYGCNMAFRAKNIEHLTFDERLVLYGWLEDRDFWCRAGGKKVWTDAIWGVHLGTTSGRSSGVSLGYSQLVNPCYLVQKGTMSPLEASWTVFCVLAGNMFRGLLPLSRTDRRKRLKGNMIGLKDVLFGRFVPERAAKL